MMPYELTVSDRLDNSEPDDTYRRARQARREPAILLPGLTRRIVHLR